MKIKKTLRFVALIFIIALACMIPIPLKFSSKDNLPKHLIEKVDKKEDEEENDNLKEIF